jgi:hypothetical protein
MAQNIIERIFGVLKRRFRILIVPPEINMNSQARLPAALGAIHTFIRLHDLEDIKDFDSPKSTYLMDSEDAVDHYGSLATDHVGNAERNTAEQRRDAIADAMWVQYVEELHRRGVL